MIDQKFLESLGVTDESAVQKITETYTADIQAEQPPKHSWQKPTRPSSLTRIWTLKAFRNLLPTGKRSMSRQRLTARRRNTVPVWISLSSSRA